MSAPQTPILRGIPFPGSMEYLKPKARYLLECYTDNVPFGGGVTFNIFQGRLSELTEEQERAVLELARNLRVVADEFQRRNLEPNAEANFPVLDLQPAERVIIRNIFVCPSVSRIAYCVKRCFTSNTLKAALQHITYNSTSVTQELAGACELLKLLFSEMIFIHPPNPILHTIDEFFEARIEIPPGGYWCILM